MFASIKDALMPKQQPKQHFCSSNERHKHNLLLILAGYLFDKNCGLVVFPRELINIMITVFHPAIEFQMIKNCKWIQKPWGVRSGPAVGAWMSTNKLCNYQGNVTFRFEQNGKNTKNFWSCIGIAKDKIWTGPGYDWDKNSTFDFYYRMDIGAINGAMDHFPSISNHSSNATVLTIHLSPGKVKVVYCNKFDISQVTKNHAYSIPKEFYLLVDIYYPDTTCFVSDEYNLQVVHDITEESTFSPIKEVNSNEEPKIEPDPDHMTTLCIAFEWATSEQIGAALVRSNNNVEAAADYLLTL